MRWRPSVAGGVLFGVLATAGMPAPRDSSSGFPAAAPSLCSSLSGDSKVRTYSVSGRIRLLLLWSGRHEVGDARITWTGAPEGARGFELLIGTDPDRAPRHLNRWGYEAETLCGDGVANLLGVMTQSDEQTMDEATPVVAVGAGGEHAFKAVRATVAEGHSNTEVFRLSLPDNLTYHNLDALLAQLPPPGSPRRTPMPSGADAGFLASMAALLHDTVIEYRAAHRVTAPIRRQFVYAGRPYELLLHRAHLPEAFQSGTTTYRGVIDAEFQTRNVATHDTTDFRVAYGTEDLVAEVPIRIEYHPRWWLALDLTLKGPQP